MNIVGNISDYIVNTLGLHLIDKGDMRRAIEKFPSLISNLFSGNLLLIEGSRYVLVKSHVAGESFPMSLLIQRIQSAEKKLGLPCILYLDTLDGNERRQLIKHKVSFIVPGRQIYIPTLGTYLTEKRLNSYKAATSLTPAAQHVVLYYLQKEGLADLGLKDWAERMGYPPKTISLVAAELAQAGICDIVSLQGRSKGLSFKAQGRQLWEQALPILTSPIDKVGYVLCDDNEIPHTVLSYDDALSHYTDMGRTPGHSFALEKRSDTGKRLMQDVSARNLPDSSRIEFWKYNPRILSRDGYIDPLSMILIYRDNEDERIQGQIKRLIDRILI